MSDKNWKIWEAVMIVINLLISVPLIIVSFVYSWNNIVVVVCWSGIGSFWLGEFIGLGIAKLDYHFRKKNKEEEK